jgi:hypothetical protein
VSIAWSISGRRASTGIFGGHGNNLTLCTAIDLLVNFDDHRRMERRSSFRQLTCIPAAFDSERSSRDLALICDASITGARLYTQGELELQEPVTLELFLGPASAEPRKVEGKVVRVERRAATVSEVWPWEVAVEFDEPITAYQKEIEDLCRRQEASGILKR